MHNVDKIDIVWPFGEHQTGLPELVLDYHVPGGINDLLLLEIQDQLTIFVPFSAAIAEFDHPFILIIFVAALDIAEAVCFWYRLLGTNDINLLLRETEEVRFVGKIACLLFRDNWRSLGRDIIDLDDIWNKSWRINRIG